MELAVVIRLFLAQIIICQTGKSLITAMTCIYLLDYVKRNH